MTETNAATTTAQDVTAVCTIFLLVFLAGFAMQAKYCIDVFTHPDPIGYIYSHDTVWWVWACLIIFNMIAIFCTMIMSCTNTFLYTGVGEERSYSSRNKIYNDSKMGWVCTRMSIFMGMMIVVQMVSFVLLVVAFSDNTELLCRNNSVVIRKLPVDVFKKSVFLNNAGMTAIVALLFSSAIFSIVHVLLTMGAFSEYRTIIYLEKSGWKRAVSHDKPKIT